MHEIFNNVLLIAEWTSEFQCLFLEWLWLVHRRILQIRAPRSIGIDRNLTGRRKVVSRTASMRQKRTREIQNRDRIERRKFTSFTKVPRERNADQVTQRRLLRRRRCPQVIEAIM